ncbi:MAG: hypothetical protein AABX98_00205 [Nanoarchaeota archaeon]
MGKKEKIATVPTIRQQWLMASITGVISAALIVYTPTSCNGSKVEAETYQQEIILSDAASPKRPTYEQWLVEKDLAISPTEMTEFYAILRSYATSNAPHPTMCMMRTSDNVSYQAGYVDPQVFNGVSEKVYGKDGEGIILEQRFPKREDMGTTQKNGTTLDAGIETKFEDFGVPAGDGVADVYFTFIYDALGERPLNPIILGRPSRTTSINKEMRETYASGQDPFNVGLGSFEKYRQAAYTEALRRFLNDPQNNKACH